MANLREIPTLDVSHLKEFHFGKLKWGFLSNNDLFTINRLEEAKNKLIFPLPPHRKTVYDFIFITNGSSTRSKGLNQYLVEKNQFFFLPALQITAQKGMSEDVKGFYVHFSPELFSDVLHLLKPFPFLNFNTNPIVDVPEREVPVLLHILERLLSLNENKIDTENNNLLVCYLLALFTEIDKFSSVQSPDLKDSVLLITQQFKDSLTQYIYTYRTVKEFAKLLHISPNHLNKSVKKSLNKTAQMLLNEMLILEAKSLLKYSNHTISQIEERLFKNTSSNFSRFFKSQVGISPKDFINQ